MLLIIRCDPFRFVVITLALLTDKVKRFYQLFVFCLLCAYYTENVVRICALCSVRKQLHDLNGVCGGALAYLIAAAPEREPVFIGQIFS